MITKPRLQLSISIGGTILLAVLTASIVGALLAGGVNAQGTGRCTLNTLKGNYVYEARGVLKDGDKVLPYAEAGFWILDGAGNAQGVFSASLNGEPLATHEAFTGTYQLKSGCVFTALAPIGNEMFEFHLYSTDQGTTMTYFTTGVSGTMFKR